jgi:glycosyltransferase involved in cell wall biosynthesis
VSKRPATLLISPWTPYPLIFGGAIRVHSTIQMLRTFSDVTLVAYESWSDLPPADVRAHLESMCDQVVLVPDKPRNSSLYQMRSIVSRRSYQYLVHHTARFQHAIDEITRSRRFSTIMVTSSPMGFFRIPETGTHVLDLHNIEYELVLRRAETSGSVRRAVMRLDGTKMRNEELALCRQFDLVLTPSDREREVLEAEGRMPLIATIPNTIDVEQLPIVPPPMSTDGPHLLFVGPTHVDANRDGVVWFVKEVLPILRHAVPDVVVDVVGGKAPPDVQALAGPKVRVHGYVSDLEPYLATASVSIVPLRVGGGTRLKILNSLAQGIPTVSTSIGAEGLDLDDGEDLLIGDDAASFAQQIALLLRDEDKRARLRANGRRTVAARYSWQALAPTLEATIAKAQHSDLVDGEAG